MDMANIRIGERIRIARKVLGLTMQEVAERVNFKHYQVLSNIESGKRPIKFHELAKLCKVLYREPIFFMQSEEPECNEPIFAWRNGKRSSNSKEVEGYFLNVLNQYVLFEKLTNQDSSAVLTPWEKTSEQLSIEEVTKRAEEFVEHYNLGCRPSRNLAETLEEQANIKLLYLDTQKEGSAVSSIGDFGHAIVINFDEPPWRRNFNLAHELFHLLSINYISLQLVHEHEGRGKPHHEKMADAFAAALLMPTRYLQQEINRRSDNNKIAWIDLVRTAVEFEVSTQALLLRLGDTGILEKKTVKKLLNSSYFGIVNSSERAHTNKPAEKFSNRFVWLGVKALKEKKISHRKLCDIFETTRTKLPDFLSQYNITEDITYEPEVQVSCT